MGPHGKVSAVDAHQPKGHPQSEGSPDVQGTGPQVAIFKLSENEPGATIPGLTDTQNQP